MSFVGDCIEAGIDAARGTPRIVWIVPVALVLGILLIYATPLAWATSKPVQEIVAPTVIALATAVVTQFHSVARSKLSIILCCFVWALFLRELHLPLTNTGFYIAIVLIAGWGVVERESLSPWLRDERVSFLLPAAIWTYFISKVFDRHYLDFLPAYYTWNDHVEETLETCGHLIVFALVIVTFGMQIARKRTS